MSSSAYKSRRKHLKAAMEAMRYCRPERTQDLLREVIKPYLFKSILEISLVDLTGGWSNDKEAIRLKFNAKSDLFLWSEEETGCESHYYISTDDDLGYFNKSTLVDIVLNPAIVKETKDYYEHEIMFLNILTSVGVITFQAHNEHNGYYGGFTIRASTVAVRD